MSSTNEVTQQPTYNSAGATGTPPSGWQYDQNLEAVKKLAKKDDPSAIALLNLYDQIKQNAEVLRKEIQSESDNFKRRLGEYERSLKRTDGLIVGVLIFISISFLTTISLVFLDLIKEKDLYLRYNDIYKNYSDQNVEQKIQIDNLENELNILKAKNPYLK